MGKKKTGSKAMKAVSKDMEAKTEVDELVPVSLLCGFLGAGKTTLLKHVLETKHAEEGFKCAVIVNDMATLNIDKALIDKSALVQSDEVIAMQNGCFCCTLRSDLMDQIKELAQKKMFSYILIEASGVSEPSQIAPMFDPCNDDHDHEEAHQKGPQLSELARLDTCVTVVDAAEFNNNLESMKVYESNEMEGTITELMMEQIEFSNVVVLNKKDLVTEKQLKNIEERIILLNPKAKIVQAVQSKINVMEILNTKLFSKEEMDKGAVMIPTSKPDDDDEVMPECCVKSVDDGKIKCCKSKNKNMIDSGLSTIMLGVVEGKDNTKPNLTRHQERFGITSFVYRARRPFHPSRLYDQYLDLFFILRFQEQEGEEKSADAFLEKLQKEAKSKQAKRFQLMGELLRSKGFVWIASSHDVQGGIQQAGNNIKIEPQGPWLGDYPEMWKGTPGEKVIYKDMIDEKGEEYPYMDRRQELVFIGHKLKHLEIQKVLDDCLLNEDEMKLGPEQWEETMADDDPIQLGVEDNDSDEEGEGEEEGVAKDSITEEILIQQFKQLFNEAIASIFKSWSALQLAVAHETGGPQSKEKAEWMVGATETWFYENEDLEDWEVADFLEDVTSAEFNLEVNDGSYMEIGKKICEYFQFCNSNSESAVRAKLLSLPRCDVEKSKVDEKIPLDDESIVDKENNAKHAKHVKLEL